MNTLINLTTTDDTFVDELKFNPTGSIVFLVIGIAILIAIVIIIIFAIKDNEIMIAIFMSVGGLGLSGVVIVFSLISLNTAKGETKFIPEKIQTWASNTYLVTIPDDQINRLMEGKIDYDEKEVKDSVPSESSDAIATYYGKKIKVSLSKYDGEWLLTSGDQELPRVGDK